MSAAAPTTAAVARARDLHQRGMDATNRGRPKLGARSLRSGLRVLGWPQESGSAPWTRQPELTVRLLGTLAAAEVARGHTDAGFALLDSADAMLTEHNRGVLALQRGLLLAMIGRLDEALRCFDTAVPLLADAGEQVALARTLLNRAYLHQIAGRARAALADLARSEQLSTTLGMTVQVAKAHHGRGSCLLLTGDIPEALRAFDLAEQGYGAHADGMQVVLGVEKARALLAAGLSTDAAAELDAILPRFAHLGMTQEHAEAELTRAQAGLAAGDPGVASAWAMRAERRFRRRRNVGWAEVAKLIALRATLAEQVAVPQGKRRLRAVAGAAADAAGRLGALGLSSDAESAVLLAARACLEAGDLDAAREHLHRRDRRPTLTTTLQRRLVLAGMASAAGERGQVFRHARAGLATLGDYRDHFGSIDLRTGVTRLGVELATLGLRSALADGNAATVFRWLERTRAQAFRSTVIHTSTDPAITDALAELRQQRHTARLGELACRPDPKAARRCAELEQRIRSRAWQSSSDRNNRGEDRSAGASLAEIKAELAHTVLVSYFATDDRLRALVVTATATRLVSLGELTAVAEAAARLRSDLDVLCGRALPMSIATTVRASIDHQVAVLSQHLLGELNLGDDDVVVVPTGVLSALPWALLPRLRGRPVTVTPSTAVWLAGRRRPRTADAREVLVAGPNLAHAEAEVGKLAEIYPEATAFAADAAAVEPVLAAVRGAGIAHFATHGYHEQDSVLFSRLELTDGPLLAYDLHRLETAPAHVILSSCSVGRSVVRPGDELLGFTAALLYSGTTTVVANVARTDDRAAVAVMTAYHRALAGGASPARALADATAVDPLTPLVCFGTG